MKMKRAATLLLSILLLAGIAGCDDTDNKGGGAGPAVGFVITSDFSVGNLSSISTTAPRTTSNGVLGSTGAHSDSVIRVFGELVFILQRFGSHSVLVIDSNNPSAPIANYSTNDLNVSGQQSNPHDIVFTSASKAYISRYGLNTLLIVNPRTGDQLGTIDLSQFADSDGLVEMDQMLLIGNRLFVSLQRLDGFSAKNDSFIVVIDTDTDELIDTTPGKKEIVLAGRNPFAMVYLPSSDRIYVANVGTFSTGDAFGGLEVINPNMGLSEGIVLTDNAFGGPLSAIAIQSDTSAYASVFDASFNNFVVPFNLTTSQVAAELGELGGGSKSALSFDNKGFLYIADRDTSSPGIQVIDTNTNLKVEGPIDTGLPPNGIVFVSP